MRNVYLITKILLLAALLTTQAGVLSLGAQQKSDYRIQPEDILEIAVYEQSDLDVRIRVTFGGEIAFPLIGKIKAADLTVGELEEKITKLLAADYLVNPQVRVFIAEYHIKQISVLGAVKKPGKYDMYAERDTTVLEAIAMAGGFSDVANADGTKVIRTEDGKESSISVKVSNITKKGQKDKDIKLEPGDIVFVPESFF